MFPIRSNLRFDRFWFGVVLVLLGLLAGSSPGIAGSNSRLASPRSHLGPSPDSSVFLGGFGQLGGGFDYEAGLPGYGAILLFRPGAAANFLPFLYSWNTGVGLQIDYQEIDQEQDILSADLVFRKYFQEIEDPSTGGSTFLGLGIGASRVRLPSGLGGAGNKYWSWLAEAGREWPLKTKYLLWVKAQYRHYDFGGANYSNWTLQAGAGIPLPW